MFTCQKVSNFSLKFQFSKPRDKRFRKQKNSMKVEFANQLAFAIEMREMRVSK